MRPNIVTITGTGDSAPIVFDYHGRPEIALQAVVSGTVTYSIQQTLDDPADSPTWFDHPDTNLVSQTVSRQGNYGYIPRAARVSVASGSGSVTLTTIQAGTKG